MDTALAMISKHGGLFPAFFMTFKKDASGNKPAI
jgi:hypothetical protein